MEFSGENLPNYGKSKEYIQPFGQPVPVTGPPILLPGPPILLPGPPVLLPGPPILLLPGDPSHQFDSKS